MPLEEFERAYASATSSAIDTYEFEHDAIGIIRYANAKKAIEVTTLSSETITFQPASIGVRRPERGVNGTQKITIQMDNVSTEAWQLFKQIKDANRINETQATCIYRGVLLSDFLEVAEHTFKLVITETVTKSKSVVITAAYMPIPDFRYPRRLYSIDKFPGLKYE